MDRTRDESSPILTAVPLCCHFMFRLHSCAKGFIVFTKCCFLKFTQNKGWQTVLVFGAIKVEVMLMLWWLVWRFYQHNPGTGRKCWNMKKTTGVLDRLIKGLRDEQGKEKCEQTWTRCQFVLEAVFLVCALSAPAQGSSNQWQPEVTCCCLIGHSWIPWVSRPIDKMLWLRPVKWGYYHSVNDLYLVSLCYRVLFLMTSSWSCKNIFLNLCDLYFGIIEKFKKETLKK